LALCKDKGVQDLVTRALHRDETPAAMRLLLLETLAQVPLDKLPAAWVTELGATLARPDDAVVRQAIVVLRAAKVADFDAALLALARDRDRSADVRVAALTAAAPRLTKLEPSLFDFLLARLDPEVPPLERLAAAQALSQATLDDAQLTALARVVATAGGLELPHLLAAYSHNRNPAVGKELVAALARAPGAAGVTPDVLRRTVEAYPEEVRTAAAPLLKRLAAG